MIRPTTAVLRISRRRFLKRAAQTTLAVAALPSVLAAPQKRKRIRRWVRRRLGGGLPPETTWMIMGVMASGYAYHVYANRAGHPAAGERMR